MNAKLKVLIPAVMALSFAYSSGANASVVYSQQVNYNDWGAAFANSPSWALYDDFRLGANSSVNSLKLWGTYWMDGVIPNPTNFLVSFHTTENNWSNPFFSSMVSASSVVDTGYNHNNVPSANIYEITLDLGTNVNFLANTDYWLGIQAINPLANNFAWQNSFVANNRYYQNNSLLRDGDNAFELSHNNNAVPEPASLALLGLGLAGLGAIRRKHTAI